MLAPWLIGIDQQPKVLWLIFIEVGYIEIRNKFKQVILNTFVFYLITIAGVPHIVERIECN